METVLTDSPEEAAEFIRSGRLVAFPTETVYGLGADIFDEAAVGKIFEAKRRPADNPLIAHVARQAELHLLATEITEHAQALIERFFPGPLTVVVKKTTEVPLIATAGLDTIGVRMPRNETARKFLSACGMPVAAPSANLSGRPSPTTWRAVFEDLDGRIDCILKGGATEIGLESTVVDCSMKQPAVLRLGAITLEQLRAVVPRTVLGDAGNPVRSPGTRHAHYQPRALVVIDGDAVVPPEIAAAYIGFHPPNGGFEIVRVVDSVEQYGAQLFEFFRECDRRRIKTVVCEPVEPLGLGAALMDRLTRAAG